MTDARESFPVDAEWVHLKYPESATFREVYGFASAHGMVNLEGIRFVPRGRSSRTLLVYMRPASTLQLLPVPRATAQGGAEMDRGFVTHRTMADPRFLDTKLDPNDRPPGACYLGHPETVNTGPVGLVLLSTIPQWARLVRDVWRGLGNLRGGRPFSAGMEAVGGTTIMDSLRLLVWTLGIILPTAGVIIIAGGGAFGGAGSLIRW